MVDSFKLALVITPPKLSEISKKNWRAKVKVSSSLTLFFSFDLFLEALAEILEKISLFFLGDLKTTKGNF